VLDVPKALEGYSCADMNKASVEGVMSFFKGGEDITGEVNREVVACVAYAEFELLEGELDLDYGKALVLRLQTHLSVDIIGADSSSLGVCEIVVTETLGDVKKELAEGVELLEALDKFLFAVSGHRIVQILKKPLMD